MLHPIVLFANPMSMLTRGMSQDTLFTSVENKFILRGSLNEFMFGVRQKSIAKGNAPVSLQK